VSGARAQNADRITVIGIDGPTAAGKTMLADAVTAALRESGLKTWTFQVDWALRARTEREADVAHLRKVGAAFEYEGELHMRLGLAQRFLEAVALFNRQIQLGNVGSQVVELGDLYSRAAGGTVTGTEVLTLEPGMVVLMEGHYTLRNELAAHIDLNVVLLADPKELLTRKVDRVKGYRSPDDAVHYFWHTDLPSFRHHLARFGRSADLIVDNTDYRTPKVVSVEAMTDWLRESTEQPVGRPRRLETASDVPEYVFSESTLAPRELRDILTATLRAVHEWDKMVGQYLRVAVDEVKEDLETLATRATEDLNREFEQSVFRTRPSHTDALHHVYHRKLPLTLGLEIYHAESNRTTIALLAEVDRDVLRVGIFWEGGVKWVGFQRTLGGISTSEVVVRDGTPDSEIGPSVAKLKVFVPTQFTMPAFLEGIEFDPVFIGREQENISASRVLSTILREGGVWIHRFALHREIKFFQYCLDVEGVPSVHVGNYLIAVKTANHALRKRFREFRRQWTAPADRAAAMQAGHDAYDAVVEAEKADVRAYVNEHCARFTIKDGAIFGNLFDQEATDAVLREMGALLRSPYRILRKRAIEFVDQAFPGFSLPTVDLWSDVPDGAQKSLNLSELTGLSSSIMAEIYLWLALRNERAAVLGANVYDIRAASLDARAFLEAAAERGCPIVLQCSLNAVGQKETDGDKTYHGYLQPTNGVEDFTTAARRAARDLYLLSGKRPPLYGIGLDHVNVANDQPAHRAKRFLQQAIKGGGLTHVVLDGSDLFQLETPGREALTRTFQKMNEWVLDLMDSPLDTFLRDMEVCISELNYAGDGSEAYLPTTADIRLFAETYDDALVAHGYACHIARPKLFISNLGTRHHSADDVRPWVELSREWRDAVKGEGFVSAVLHGTSRSHQDTLAASTVGCHKVNVAGDFLDTIVDNLPMRLSRIIQEGDTLPKKMLPVIRPEMDRISESETRKLYGALKEHCARILKTIASPRISSMDANYFQYKDFEFSDKQVGAILGEVRRELGQLMPKAARRLTDSRQGCDFAASMIEVPYEEFRGPILDALWAEGIRYFHVDEGDGVFISRRFSGVEKVRYLREHFPTAVIHAHLMVVNPHYPKDGEFCEIQQYAEAGVDGIAIHIRSCGIHWGRSEQRRGDRSEAVSALKIIRKWKVRPGIVIETSDSVDENLEALIRNQGLDWVVAMGVPIGYGGQVFQYSTLNRISRLHDLAGRLGRDFLLECDGGLNFQNLELCRNAGGQLFSGWSIIKGNSVDEMKQKVRTLRGILSKAE
jgi:ribulose-phosphate 3-epimerase